MFLSRTPKRQEVVGEDRTFETSATEDILDWSIRNIAYSRNIVSFRTSRQEHQRLEIS